MWIHRTAARAHRRVAVGMMLAPALLLVIGSIARAEELPLDRINPRGHSGDVLAVAFSPDSKILVTGGADRLGKLWDVATGSVRADLAGHAGTVLCVAASPDSKLAATAGDDGV